MMRPFISSFGSDDGGTVVSAVWSAAMRWMASATIFFASRSALRLARLTNLADAVGRVGLGLFFHAPHQLVLGVLRGHAGHLLEPAAFLGDQLLELLLASGDRFFAPPELARARDRVFVALFEDLELPVENGLALGDAALLALDLFAAPADFDLEFSRSLMSSSLPVTTALFRRFSDSRSASPMIRFEKSLRPSTWRRA